MILRFAASDGMMKKIILLVSVVLLLLAIRNAESTAIYLPESARAVVHRLALPFRIARLAAKEPDLKLSVPVEEVTIGQIKDTWAAARDGERVHEGQDIFARRGTVVRSATEGYVARVGENRLGGNVVFVMGAGGRRYYYAHLDAFAPGLTIGDYVTPQTVIGYVGTTGNAQGTPPHLHFGVYGAEGAIDPLPLMTNSFNERLR